MYLMDSRILLDAEVFNGRKKLLKQSLQTSFSVNFLEFCFFSHFYLKLKSIHCSTTFCCKNDCQFGRKEEMETMREEREWLFVCYILDIFYLLINIIHWIAWTHSMCIEWWSRLLNKVEIHAPNGLNILYIFYWVQ